MTDARKASRDAFFRFIGVEITPFQEAYMADRAKPQSLWRQLRALVRETLRQLHPEQIAARLDRLAGRINRYTGRTP